MANVQKQFEEFHNAIRTDYDMNATLREKRDIILDRLRKHLKDNDRPGFVELLQGSYSTKTGVIPIGALDYDIDVGLRFYVSPDDHDNSTVHNWVYEGVDGHTEDVDSRGPCVRVAYQDGYHVDLVPYSCKKKPDKTEEFKLAHKTKGWLEADPPTLSNIILAARQKYDKTEDSLSSTDQFRRCIRYLRRWDDVAVPKASRAKPTGLAFTLLAIEHLNPTFDLSGISDDRLALNKFVRKLISISGRLTAIKPTPEYEDILLRLTDADMAVFKERLNELLECLKAAYSEPDPVKACAILRSCFGEDFPIPSPEDTGKKSKSPAIITSSSSA